MTNIRLTLAYDGADYAGWQVQPCARTVQGELELAIRKLTGESVRVLSSGRTDAGVHALGQVASFQTESSIPADRWRAALQGQLPTDIIVLESADAPADFHATYSATSKRYRYVIRTALIEDPFLRRYVWRINADLDVDAMAAAARSLLGTHDFRCFETEFPNKATSVRTVLAVDVRRASGWNVWSPAPITESIPPASGGRQPAETALNPAGAVPSSEFLCFEIEADGFLYNMVRAIVGTLVNIGRGKWPVTALGDAITSQDRSRAGETAPAQGLYLVLVRYPDVVCASR
jgi:tRNA pseudouridine38-40 synthase